MIKSLEIQELCNLEGILKNLQSSDFMVKAQAGGTQYLYDRDDKITKIIQKALQNHYQAQYTDQIRKMKNVLNSYENYEGFNEYNEEV